MCKEYDISGKGVPQLIRSDLLKASLKKLVDELKNEYGINLVSGHNEYANKACPCFNVKKEF